MIRDAGFDGAGVRFIDSSFATEVTCFSPSFACGAR